MTKRLLFILLVMILPVSFVFAGGGGGESVGNYGYSVYYFPSKVANNQSVFVELTQQKSASISTLGTSFSDAISSDYENSNLVVCCLMDTLNNTVQTGNVNLTITSSDASGFYFKKDGNDTIKAPFEIEVCCAAFYKGDNAATFGSRQIHSKLAASESIQKTYTTTRKVGSDWGPITGRPYTVTTEKLNYTINTGLSKNGSNTYVLNMYTSDYSNTMNTDTKSTRYETNEELPNIITYYYVCLKLPENQNLESGYYTATFTVNATFNSKDISGTVHANDKISETISVKGYVGEEPEISDTEFSFFLAPGANTYFMDLEVESGNTPPVYDVARVQFNFTTITTSPSNPASTNQRRAYKIYVSPTNLYTVSGDYQFIRNGTERQDRVFANTVYYDLLIETSEGTYEKLSASADYTGNGNNAKANAQSHFTTGKIGGVTKVNNTNTYLLYPLYDSQQTSSGASNKWKETWEMNEHIFLQIKDESTEIQSGQNARRHQEGVYTSTIYFTIVSP